MRVNVYAEELTEDYELVVKHVDDSDFGPRSFYGIRLFLESPDVLHTGGEDDDRSAVTFWVPWTREGGHDFQKVIRIFAAMMNIVADTEQRS